MTIVNSNHSTPACPPLSLHKLDEVAMATVDDRTPELQLMDGDANTCFDVFDQGRRPLHLMTYVYVPQFAYSLQVTLVSSGLTCTNPQLTVFHKIPMADERHGIRYQECSIGMITVIGSGVQQCDFMCFNVCTDASVVKVGIRAEMLSWSSTGSAKICSISTRGDWAVT